MNVRYCQLEIKKKILTSLIKLLQKLVKVGKKFIITLVTDTEIKELSTKADI